MAIPEWPSARHFWDRRVHPLSLYTRKRNITSRHGDPSAPVPPGLFVIIVVTAVVGLVVVRRQPGNPIGWLLAGTAIFMLANIAAGSYAQLKHFPVAIGPP